MTNVLDEKRPATILIADDDNALRSSLRSVFEPMGFTVYLAPGGTRAVTLARERAVDLAILDIHMPDLDGIETILEIRKTRDSVNCIFITSDTSRSVRRRIASSGAWPIVRKPIRIERLRCAVLNMLGGMGKIRGC